MPRSDPNIVVIGGGTGSFMLLSALKLHPANLTALVNMADSGGSTGLLRDELGVLPPGDIRQCLVALSDAPQELRDLFNFRFPESSLGGHSFGNLFLSAVESMTHDFNDAVRIAGDVLRIKGRVLPITLTNCQLVLQTATDRIVGQYTIAETALSPSLAGRPRLLLEPTAVMTELSGQAILEADLVIIAPGNLYGSLAPALLVEGVGTALADTAATVVFVCNLVNKPNHTSGFAVHDYAAEIERFAGSDILDYVLYNSDEPDEALLARYALDQEYPVRIDSEALRRAHYVAQSGAFLSRGDAQRNPHDTLIHRSLIRHDGEALMAALIELGVLPKL